MKRIVILFFLSLSLLYTSAGSIFAEAPTVPKITFTSARDGNREIYIMKPDGSEQVNLTQHDAGDLQPAWSPTGEEILFVSDQDGIGKFTHSDLWELLALSVLLCFRISCLNCR